jgi:hypothetical protein
MKALRFGVAVALSAARSGTMHSSMGREMKLPSALSAWRRLRSQDWVWMFMEDFDTSLDHSDFRQIHEIQRMKTNKPPDTTSLLRRAVTNTSNKRFPA